MINDQLPYGTSVIPEFSHWTGYCYLHVVRRVNNELWVPEEIKWKRQDEGMIRPDAAIRLEGNKSVQKLFDDLYALGLRPSDGKNNDAVIVAKDAHIDDLRAIMKAYLTKPIAPEPKF